MGEIRVKYEVIGRKGTVQALALYDTGSSHSLIRDDIARLLDAPFDLPEPKEYELAVGTCRARQAVVADVLMQGKRLTTLFKVVHHLTEEMILGDDFMQTWHVKLDLRNELVEFDPRAIRQKAVGMRVPRSRR